MNVIYTISDTCLQLKKCDVTAAHILWLVEQIEDKETDQLIRILIAYDSLKETPTRMQYKCFHFKSSHTEWKNLVRNMFFLKETTWCNLLFITLY